MRRVTRRAGRSSALLAMGGLVLVVAGAGREEAPRSSGAPGAARPAPVLLSGPGEEINGSVVERADRRGDVLVVWPTRAGRASVLHSAWRPPSGGWTTGIVSRGIRGEFAVGLGADGRAVVAWTQLVGGGEVVEVSTRTPDGSWGAPQAITDPSAVSFEPKVAVDEHGDGVAVWTRTPQFSSHRFAVQAAQLTSGHWGAVQTVSPPGPAASAPQIAVNARGDAVIDWRSVTVSRGYGHSRVVAVSRQAGASWSAAQVVADNAYDAQVGLDDAGRALSVFSVNPRHRAQSVEAARASPGGTWTRPTRLVPRGGYKPALAVSANGRAVAAWEGTGERSPIARRRHGFPGPTIQASVFGAGGRWSAPVRVPARYAYGDEVVAAADARGDLALAWRSLTLPGVSVSPPGGGWSRPHLVSSGRGDGSSPALAVTSDGRPVVSWVEPAGLLLTG